MFDFSLNHRKLVVVELILSNFVRFVEVAGRFPNYAVFVLYLIELHDIFAIKHVVFAHLKSSCSVQ